MPEVIPISQIPGLSTSATTAPATAPDQLGKDAFMKLLVAQLKYQNPLSPSDPSQFMAQTAQFTMVEELTKLTDAAARQVALGEAGTAAALLGRQVTWLDQAGAEHRGTVSGSTFGTAGTFLHVGDERVALDRITQVTQAPTTPNQEA